MDEREGLAWMSTIPEITQTKMKKYLSVYHTPQVFFDAKIGDMKKNLKIEQGKAEEIEKSKKIFDPEKFFANLKEKNINFVTVYDDIYPKKLMPFSDKPYFLFYRGNLPFDDCPCVAMVGARACSEYGAKVARDMAKTLSDSGVRVISGMARGIDTYSAKGALEGKTPAYAVFGCGVDVCYPPENSWVYDKLCKMGGVISEYPPSSPPLSWHFPQRNRIISALADKIVVVEARKKSGSLITVEWALEQGKDVMAVPGPVTSKLSDGCNLLIRSGAEAVRGADDIIEEFLNESKYDITPAAGGNCDAKNFLEKDLAVVYSELSLQPKSIDMLMDDTGLEYGELMERLLALQLKGVVNTNNNYYTRAD